MSIRLPDVVDQRKVYCVGVEYFPGVAEVRVQRGGRRHSYFPGAASLRRIARAISNRMGEFTIYPAVNGYGWAAKR